MKYNKSGFPFKSPLKKGKLKEAVESTGTRYRTDMSIPKDPRKKNILNTDPKQFTVMGTGLDHATGRSSIVNIGKLIAKQFFKKNK